MSKVNNFQGHGLKSRLSKELLREDIKRKTAERVKFVSFTLPLPPSTERVKNKRINLLIFKVYCNTFVGIWVL